MAQVPLLRPEVVIKTFEGFGWSVARQRGSHIIMTKSGQMVTLSIPNHAQVARGTLRRLIQLAGLTVEEFVGEED